MTIINPNSISGISSITALNSTAAINLFKADGTAANIIAGVTTGTNFKTGSSNLHNVGIEIAGINVLGADTPIGAGATIYNSGAALFTGNLNIEGGSASLSQLKINSTGRYRGVQLDENGTRKAHFQHDATNNKTIVGTAEGTLQFNSGDTGRIVLNSSGHWVPMLDSTYDLGIGATRWRNVYADTYYGDGSNLTGISADKIFENNSKVEVVDTGTGYITAEVDGTERLRVNDSGIDVSGEIELDNGGSAGLNFKRNGTLKADIEIGSTSDELAIRARGSSGFILLSTGSSATPRLRIDSVGNLVTGNQTSPTSSDTGNIYIKNGSTIGSVSHQLNYATNAVFDSSWKYITSGVGATRIVVNQNGYKFDTATSGTAGNAITFSERFNINADGKVVKQQFTATNTYAANDTTQCGYQSQNLSDTTNTYSALRLTAGNSSPATAQLSSIRTGAGANDFTIQLETGNTAFEALRIKSTGQVLIGTDTVSTTNLVVYSDGTEDNKPATLYQNSLTGTGAGNGFYVGSNHNEKVGYVWNYESDKVVFATNNQERVNITSTGQVNIGGDFNQTTYTMKVTGSFAATTKSFVIDHPTKEKHKLRYACLEGPENSVYIRGKTSDSVIELPDYWTGLVHEDSITVNVTPIGNHKVWVESINNNSVTIGSDGSEYFYTVFAERKDVDKLEVEVEE